MNTQEPNQRVETKAGNEVAKAIVEFMADCGLGATDVSAFNVGLALEYVYRPLPRFWRDFDMAALVDAISERFPEWRSAVQKPDWTGDDELREVEEILHCHAFDEANAEMMMALPEQARPTDDEAASDWIRAELRERKLEAELRFAERDGNRCGVGALQELHCLESAANGVEFERLGTGVARHWRKQVLAESQNGGKNA
jgi:hypothetical protein